MRTRIIDLIVGLFMVAGLIALAVLAFRVSGLTHIGEKDYYVLTADFDNIGGLKVRAPVTVSGVKVGRVAAIKLDDKSYRAEVILHIHDNVKALPTDTSASILTQGLLGSNYIALTPGFEEKYLKPNGQIETTHSAMILENVIGQLIFSAKNKKGNTKKTKGVEL